MEGLLRGGHGGALSVQTTSGRELILRVLPATIQLAVAALLIAVAIAIPLGVVAGSIKERG